MSFFFEFVPCCGSRSLRREETETDRSTSGSEERRSLMRLTSGGAARRSSSSSSSNRRRAKFDRKKVPGSREASTEWKPTLTAISENNAVVMLTEKKSDQMTGGSSGEKKVKRRSGESRLRIQGRDRKDDLRGNSNPTIIFGFSPTPIMF